MQNILSLLQKIYDTNNHPDKSVIEIDIMMDYTRLLYEELSFERQKLMAQKTPPNFYNIWNNPGKATPETKQPEPLPEQPEAIPTSFTHQASEPVGEVISATQYNIVLPTPIEESATLPVPVNDEPVTLANTAPEETIAETYTPEETTGKTTRHHEEYTDVVPEPEIVYEDGGSEQFADIAEEKEEEGDQEDGYENDINDDTTMQAEEPDITEDKVTMALITEEDEEEEVNGENTWEIEEELRAPGIVNTPVPVAAPVYPQQPVNSYYQPAARTHQDIRRLIGINDKYQVMSELFHNNKDAYETALNEINKKEDFKSAIDWLQNQHPQMERDGYTFHLFEGVLHRYYND